MRLDLGNDVAVLGYAVSEITSIFPEEVFLISRLRFKLDQVFEYLDLVHVCLRYIPGLFDFKLLFIWSERMVENATLNIERIPFQVELVTCMVNLVEGESIFGHKVNFKRLMQKFFINKARVTNFYVQLGVILSFIVNFYQVLVNDENRLPWQLLVLSKLLERLFAIKWLKLEVLFLARIMSWLLEKADAQYQFAPSLCICKYIWFVELKFGGQQVKAP